MTRNGCVSYSYVISGEGGEEQVCLWDGNPVFPRDRAAEGAQASGDGGNLSRGEGRPRLCFLPEVTCDLATVLDAPLVLFSLPGKRVALQHQQQLLGLHGFRSGVQTPNWVL